MSQQLSLNVNLRDDASFANFYVTQANQAIVAYLQKLFDQTADQSVYLWSAPQQGRSHLLQASCHLANERNLTAVYLPLHEIAKLNVEILQDLESFDLICLDDIDVIAGNKIWEEGIFHLYNRLQLQGRYLLVSANCAPHELPLALPDLKSRLSAATVFHLQPLNDDEKLAVLQLRSQRRGLTLSTQVGKFLLHHWPRDNNAIFTALDKLDQASLVSKRQITIPFVKEVLGI